jgi:flagellar biosynthesis GTPase FlhF
MARVDKLPGFRQSSPFAPAIAGRRVSDDGGDIMAPRWTIAGLAGGALLLVAAPLRAQSSDDMQRAFERQRDNTKDRAAQEADEQKAEVNTGAEQQTRKAEEAAKDETEAAKSSAEKEADKAKQTGQQQTDKAKQTGQQQTEKAKQTGQQQTEKAKQTNEKAKQVPSPDPTIPLR